jgi:hypothetical protein
VRGADDDLDVRIHGPQAFDRLQPVPARRHAHVDEGECKGAAALDGAFDHAETLLALQGEVQLERRMQPGRGAVAEQDSFGFRHGRVAAAFVREDLLEILVDRRIVVDDQDAAID